jgi:hypothetical protein
MTPAFIIKNREMSELLKAHLANQGYDVSKLTVRFTTDCAVVAGIKEKLVSETAESLETDEVLETAPEDQIAMVRKYTTAEPRTVSQLVELSGLTEGQVNMVLTANSEEFKKVAPARENGRTVPMFMSNSLTWYFNAFMAKENSRIDTQVQKYKGFILDAVEGDCFEDRESIVARVTNGLSEGFREEFQRDARAIFYAMLENGYLEHEGHGWRAA